MSKNFIEKLPIFHSFKDSFVQDNYEQLPADWLIIATDVKGSTKAIEQGRYKEVNTLGASSIITLINACSPQSLCYQFGGDGALIAIPPDKKNSVFEALSYLNLIAEDQFKLKLRIGVWSVGDFFSRGYEFGVLRIRVSEENYLYMFSGEGVDQSDIWLKGNSPAANQFEKIAPDKNRAYVDGLECRWNPLLSKRGKMLTAILKPRGSLAEKQKIVQKIFAKLESLNEEQSRLVQVENLQAKFPPIHYLVEWKIKHYNSHPLYAAICFLGVMLKLILLTPIVYMYSEKIPFLKEYATHSDFQKFDGMLRFVRDMAEPELKDFEGYCQDLFVKGELFYGFHHADSALMTCMVYSLQNHIHFIDGDNGGYAIAAKQLKSQIELSK